MTRPRSTATFATVARNFGRKGDRQSGSLRDDEGVSAPKDARNARFQTIRKVMDGIVGIVLYYGFICKIK